ncbi:hypothetical protein [Campylobacter troglodytis]|nr:hypothetical protein [Campylobacter troglodytis]
MLGNCEFSAHFSINFNRSVHIPSKPIKAPRKINRCQRFFI